MNQSSHQSPATDPAADVAASEARRLRDQRALLAFHNISRAGRGQGRNTVRALLNAVSDELRALFALDSCFIGLSDAHDPNRFRATLLFDEGLIDYVEGTGYGPVTGRVIRERASLRIPDLNAHRSVMAGHQTTFGNTQKLSRSWLGAPLLVDEDVVGVIAAQSYAPNRFTSEDQQLLERVAQVVAVALEHVNLTQHQRDLSRALAERVAARTEELVAISAVASETVLERGLPELLDRALALILPLLGAQAGVVRTFNPTSDALQLQAQRGLPNAPALLPLDDTLTGQVFRANAPLHVSEDLAAHDGGKRLANFASWLGVPLRVGARALGTLVVLGTRPQQYDQQHIDLVQVIANQLAIAVENAGLLAERERQIAELRALGAIGNAALQADDLPTLLAAVHAALAECLPIDSFLMFVYDPVREVVIEGLGIDDGTPYHFLGNEPPPERSFTAWVIRHRTMLHLPDVAAAQANDPELGSVVAGANRPAASWLGVPLLRRDDQIIGTIAVQSYTLHAFDARAEQFMTQVATQVALHVQNVELLLARARQIRALDAIGQVGAAASSAFDLDAMLGLTYQALHQVLDTTSFVALICAPGGFVEHAFLIDDGAQVEFTLPNGQLPPSSLASALLRTNTPLLFHDLPAEHEALAARGIAPVVYGMEGWPRSWAGVPLLGPSATPIGVIAVQDARPRQFDAQTLDLLAQIATHLSLGVQKVRLFAAEQAARRRADTLREVARTLSSSFDDPERVLELILSELARVVPYDSAAVMLHEHGQLRLVASAPRIAAVLIQTPSTWSAAAKVAREGRAVLYDDVRQAAVWQAHPAAADIVGWIGVPLIARSRVIGVLNINSHRPHAFVDLDVAAASAFAGQAALALDNARLYAEQVTRVERELEIAQTIQAHLFPRRLPVIPGFTVAARCLPARATGGDFFDVQPMPNQGIALIVGDASGKSIPGALLMAIARSVARAELRDHPEPAVALRETNRLVSQDIPPGSFVALAIGVLYPGQRTLTLVSAGQLAPLHHSAAGQVAYLDVPDPRLPLGIDPDLTYVARDVLVQPGETVLFYTDGVVEARNSGGELFGFDRLVALLRAHAAAGPDALITTITQTIAAFVGSAPPHDDLTLVALRADP